MADDVKITHAREFTNIENTTLDAWLQAENAGLDVRAAALLNAGLMYEHYTSLLDSDPDKRALHEVVKQQELAQVLNDQIRLLNNEIRTTRLHKTVKLVLLPDASRHSGG